MLRKCFAIVPHLKAGIFRTGLVVLIALAGVAFLVPVPAAEAVVTGSLSTLTFSGCNQFNVEGGFITLSEMSSVQLTLIDGAGTQVYSDGGIVGAGLYGAWGTALYSTLPTANPIHAELVITDGDGVFVVFSGSADSPCLPPSGTSTGGGIRDGRLCRWDQYAVYTTGEIIDVYGIQDRKGFFVLRVTQDELDAAPGAAGVNTLVKSSNNGLVQVYRLGDTETLQVHAGLDFVRFTGLPASGVVCSNIDLD